NHGPAQTGELPPDRVGVARIFERAHPRRIGGLDRDLASGDRLAEVEAGGFGGVAAAAAVGRAAGESGGGGREQHRAAQKSCFHSGTSWSSGRFIYGLQRICRPFAAFRQTAGEKTDE